MFNLDTGQAEIEIVTLQNKRHLKTSSLRQTFGALWTQRSARVYAHIFVNHITVGYIDELYAMTGFPLTDIYRKT